MKSVLRSLARTGSWIFGVIVRFRSFLLCFLFVFFYLFFFFSSRRRHTRCSRDWSSDVCSSDLFGGWLLTDELARQKGIAQAGQAQQNQPPRSFAASLRTGRHKTAPRRGRRARSEERRVGKEWRTRGTAEQEKKKKEKQRAERTK